MGPLHPKMFSKVVSKAIKQPQRLVRLASTGSLKDKTIGVIGMGHVGTAVTQNLLKSDYKVTTILDLDKDKCSNYPTCKVATSARQVAEEVDITITALPMPPHVKAMFEGDNGLLAGMDKGKVWIDHSTTDYEATMIYNDMVLDKGAQLLEAPITGGLAALSKGQMTVFTAGDETLATQVRPLMKASFQNVLYTGPLGTAMIPKVFSNLLCAVNIIAAAEAMMVAKKAGLDMKTFWDAIRSSSGNSFVWETGGPMVMQGNYDPSFDIALHCKDNQLCYDIAKKHKVPLEVCGLAQQIFHHTMYRYGDTAPCYSSAKMLEDNLNESLHCEDFKEWTYSIDDVDGSAVIRHHGIKLTQDPEKNTEE